MTAAQPVSRALLALMALMAAAVMWGMAAFMYLNINLSLTLTCERADAEYVARVNAFLGKVSTPAFSATLDQGYGTRLFAGIVLLFSVLPLVSALYLLRWHARTSK